MKLWDFINDINGKQQNLMEGTDNDELAEKTYVPYIVNKQLSYFPDTILYAQEMNANHHLDNKLQYSFYLNSIRPRKRFTKWSKRQVSEDVDIVRQYYGYDINKAEQALLLLSPEDLQRIKQRLNQGGL